MNEAREEVRDLLAAWALDAVDDVERARVERAIREDPELAREARALVETASRLADMVTTAPPPSLREAVLTEAESVPQRPAPTAPASSSAAGAPPAGPVRGRRSRVAAWIAAAAVATIGVAAPTVLAIQQAGRAERAEQEVAMLAEAMARPGAQIASAEVAGGGQAVAVITEEGAFFLARGLDPLADDLAYQLWIVEGETATSAGVLDSGRGLVNVEVEGAVPGNALALTVEPAGGSLQPTTEPVVVLPPPEGTSEEGASA